MTQKKVDPRMLRTRQLIMDAFIDLSGQKEFRDITVKDITEEAMINRATFYYHFKDIYDLLDKALSEVLLINLNTEVFDKKELNKEFFTSAFLAITNFQNSLSNRCHRGYEETIARIIREQLEIIFYKALLKQHDKKEDRGLKTTAVVLSWGLYGASVEWRGSFSEQSPEQYIETVIPYILSGLYMKTNN